MEVAGNEIGLYPVYMKVEGDKLLTLADPDNACMKIAVVAFEILTQVEPKTGFIGGPRIVLHLKQDLRNSQLNEGDLIGLAAASVLKILHRENCVGKDALTYQYRIGPYNPDSSNVSEINSIGLKRHSLSQLDQLQRSREGIISHSYAYVTERQLCLFLNNTNSETLKKIEEVLVKHFPKK